MLIKPTHLGFLPAVLALGLVTAGSADADVRLRLYVQSDGGSIMGREIHANSDTNVVWLTEGRACWQLGDSTSFVSHEKDGMLYIINHKAKQYSQLPLGQLYQSDDPQLKQMLEMMKMEITVTPTDQTLKIDDWDCKKYVITKKMPMMEATTHAWVTKDIEADYTALNRLMRSTMAYYSNYPDILKEFDKIDGIVVRETTRLAVMGQEMTSSTDLVDISHEDAPKDTFSVPEGYKQTEHQIPGMQ